MELLYKDNDDTIRLTSKLKREILKSCIYGVDIDTKKVLHINTIKKLESFHKEYSIQVSTFLLNHKIKWDVLTEKWSGIFIEYMYPYLDQFRYPVHQEILSWYGTWDCESGCIWNIDAIKKINVLYKKI